MSSTENHASPEPAAARPGADPGRPTPGGGGVSRIRRTALALAALAAAVVAVAYAALWWADRAAHSLTDDAFVEAHVVNLAPETVSGRIVGMFVDEGDRVEQGQVVAAIDPTPYRDRVNLASSRLEAATREHARQQADLARLRREVPIQIEIARRALETAVATRSKADASVTLTEDDVEKGVDEARATVKAAKADLLLALHDHDRYTTLQKAGSVTLREQEESTRSHDSAAARLELAEAKLAKAVASRTQVVVARNAAEAAGADVRRSERAVDLAKTADDQIRVAELQAAVKESAVAEARRSLEAAEHDLDFTKVRSPISGVVVRRYRNLGDFATSGVAVLSLYDPDLLYVTANLEETRLPGVAPGNAVRIEVDAFDRPFAGRVVWVNKSTGAQFSLMPRNVVSGEFTRVVQRVPVRIQIERDGRWPALRAGLSARVAIAHGPGDPDWASREAGAMAGYETRFNRPNPSSEASAANDPRRGEARDASARP